MRECKSKVASVLPSYNMTDKPLHIRFYHPDIENFSDGTLRKLIREFSKLARQLLLDEAELLLREMNLNYRQYQSIHDIVQREFTGGTNFIVDEIEKGSFKLGGALTVVALSILKGTLWKSIEKAYDRSELGQEVEEQALEAFNKIARHLKNRKRKVRKLAPKYKNQILANSFKVDDVTLEEETTKTVINFDISSIDQRVLNIEEPPATEDLQESIKDEIKYLKRIVKNKKN